MKTFYSACKMKETSLALGALPQGVRSDVDLVSLIVEPEDLVPVIFKLEIVKPGGINTKKFKHLTLCEQRPQIHDARKAVLPDDPDHTEYDRLCARHSDYVSHCVLRLWVAVTPEDRASRRYRPPETSSIALVT